MKMKSEDIEKNLKSLQDLYNLPSAPLQHDYYSTNIDTIPMPSWGSQTLTSYPATYNTIPIHNYTTKISYGEYAKQVYKMPTMSKAHSDLDVMIDGEIESVSYAELSKYISERKLVRENEVVRKVYDRYQVAVKLIRSDDNGDTGV
jgi:hypothetical protein